MKKTHLDAMIRELKKVIATDTQHPSQQLDMLLADLEAQYLGKYDNLDNPYLKAWDEAVLRRLQGMTTVSATMLSSFTQFKLAWRDKTQGCLLKIYFGQMRVGPDFQGSLTTNQQNIVGFPQNQVVGRQLTVVSGSIGNGTILPDQIPVQIFYSGQKWIAVNNRGYAAYCRAGVPPLRLWPRPPETAESNRLSDEEGKGDIGTFTYPPQLGARLSQSPRKLPSLEMPVTTGPNTWVVQEIITVPQTFN
jgi:hypothetical protein